MHPPKQKNTTVEQSLRSDTSNSRSSEYILYWYTTRFNLAVWRGSLVEAKYTDLYKFSRLSKTPARSTLFQVDFDIVMYVNYNILYLRSCIYYCMYLSIGVAMGNRDFSCTSKKVGLEYSLSISLSPSLSGHPVLETRKRDWNEQLLNKMGSTHQKARWGTLWNQRTKV